MRSTRPKLDTQSEAFLEQLAKDAVDRAVQAASLSIPNLLTQMLTASDVTVLMVLGVDVRTEILDVFIAECNRLKEELKNEQ